MTALVLDIPDHPRVRILDGLASPDLAERLTRDINATLQLPEVKERLAGLGLEVVAGSPQQYTQLLQKDVAKWTDAVKRSGAVAE